MSNIQVKYASGFGSRRGAGAQGSSLTEFTRFYGLTGFHCFGFSHKGTKAQRGRESEYPSEICFGIWLAQGRGGAGI